MKRTALTGQVNALFSKARPTGISNLRLTRAFRFGTIIGDRRLEMRSRLRQLQRLVLQSILLVCVFAGGIYFERAQEVAQAIMA